MTFLAYCKTLRAAGFGPRGATSSVLRFEKNERARKIKHQSQWGTVVAMALSVAGTCTGSALAESSEGFSLRRSRVAGGGGTTTGGGYALLGTVGEHDAGTVSGGGYELTGGYWASTSVAPNAPELPSDVEHQARKNRYISLDLSTNTTTAVAYEVTLASMKRCSGDERRACAVDADCPGVCTGNNDLQCSTDDICGPDGPCLATSPCIEHSDAGNVTKWIDEPVASSCYPTDDCTGQWFAGLTSSPVYRVWTEDTLHITDCGMIPVATFEVRSTVDGIVFSEPMTIGTIEKPDVHYGDCVDKVEDGEFLPPQGVVNITDVQAYQIAVQGGSGDTAPPHTTWVDLNGYSEDICDQPFYACVVPQQILGVGDLLTIKFGFIGQTYVETPGQENPGDCP